VQVGRPWPSQNQQPAKNYEKNEGEMQADYDVGEKVIWQLSSPYPLTAYR
jgi:hypothetical protein